MKLVLAALCLTACAAATSRKSCSDFKWQSFVDKSNGKRVCTASFCSGQFFDESLGFMAKAQPSDEVTLQQAQKACDKIGARMCTLKEIQADELASSACYHKAKRVWTAESCESTGALIAQYNFAEEFRSITSTCVAGGSSKAFAQCCVDFRGTDAQEKDESQPALPKPATPLTRETCFSLGWTRTLQWDSIPKNVCGASYCGGQLTDVKKGGATEPQRDSTTHAAAADICEQAGARLCTADEVVGDQEHGNNCWPSRTRVWSSTPCDGGFEAVWTTRSAPTQSWAKTCTRATARLNVRCCASTVSSEQAGQKKPAKLPEKNCAVGKFFDASNALVPCVSCPAGKFGELSRANGKPTCTMCGVGFYQKYFGRTSCKQCADGLFALKSRIGCTEAGGGMDAMVCDTVGTFKDTAAGACAPCPKGSYGFKSHYNKDAECAKCPAGTISNAKGVAKCTKCEAGKFASSKRQVCNSIAPADCPVGTFHQENDPNESGCTPCPVGSFGYKDANSISACKRCPEGSHQMHRGKASCTPCATGTYSSSDGSHCTFTAPQCKAGKYADAVGYCQKCPAGKFGAMKLLEDGSNAESGAIEVSKTETACYRCEAGSYQNKPGQTSCDTCGTHLFSTDDATACTARRDCKNGPVSVKDGWRGPGWGKNYCNMCKCQDGKLGCQTHQCYGKHGKKECSHTTCKIKRVRSSKTGQLHDVLRTLHHHLERNGRSVHCQYSPWLNRCECLCES